MKLEVGKWYVLDRFSRNPFISGPFDTESEAEKDRLEWNCADDYIVHKLSIPQTSKEVTAS